LGTGPLCRSHACVILDRMAKRLLRGIGTAFWQLRIPLMYAAAYLWRTVLFRTTFIAITGSMGKTTAKEFLAGALATRFPTASSLANQNGYAGVPRSVLRVRPWHRFAVIEVAADGRGLMRSSARLVRPDIAIVLLVGRCHMREFRTLDNVAADKSILLSRLKRNGIALLNGDDALVAAMAGSLPQRVVWFGSSTGFDYQAEAPSSNWPRRLSFELRAGAEHISVRTRLVGVHWKYSVLAAIAAANICGLSLDEAVAAAAEIEPVPGRMQPVRLPSGAVVIRDEIEGSIDALKPAFDVFATASAARRILVISGVTNISRSPRDRYRAMGRDIARIFELAVFVGDAADHGVRGALAAGQNPSGAYGFSSLWQAGEFLARELRPGDLVLLRGRLTDHLTRLCFDLAGPVACHRTICQKTMICDNCSELGAAVPLLREPPALEQIVIPSRRAAQV